MTDIIAEQATAAASGAAATEQFRNKQRTETADVDTKRVDTLVSELLAATHDIIRRHKLTYAEYDVLKSWLIQVGEDGEWPLFLDVWIEHVVEEVAFENREGTKGTIEGPYYVSGAPSLPAEATLPMREGEGGTPLLFQGQVRSVDGSALAGATVDIWQADDDGYYSQFAPGLPEWNLRGSVTADDQGNFRIHTVEPAPYQPDGRLLRQADQRRGLARLAPRPPAPEGLGVRPPTHDDPAVLQGRQLHRGGHRLRRQAGTHPRSRSVHGRQRP